MPVDLSAAADFLAERHLATLTTFRADGSAHVVPVGSPRRSPAMPSATGSPGRIRPGSRWRSP